MTGGHRQLDFHGLMEQLGALCKGHRTGTMFITTSDNHAVRFVLHEGNITSCSYSVKRGYDALEKIKTITGGSYRFADDIFTSMDELDLPPTADILQTLLPGAAVNAAPSPPDGEAAPVAGADFGEALEVIKYELARFLGPVAAMYCEDYLDDEGPISDANHLKRMVEALAMEIGDPAKETIFKDEVRTKVKVL